MPRPSCGLSAGVKRFNVGRTFERKHRLKSVILTPKRVSQRQLSTTWLLLETCYICVTDFYPTALQVSVQYNYRFGDQRPTLDNNF